jgi:hypothetical protein
MTLEQEYARSIQAAVSRIGSILPDDLVDHFIDATGLEKDAFSPIRQSGPGSVCGIDGSNALVLEGASGTLAALRAGACVLSQGCLSQRRLTPLRLAWIGPGGEGDFCGLYRECFGEDPITPLSLEDPMAAAAVLRDTLEYWVALREASECDPGTLLLLDGSLRVNHASHDPVLQRIVQTAKERGVFLAAIAKRTSLTWGGGYPLLPAVNGLAARHEISFPWWISIDPEMLDHTQYLQWQHGDLYIASLHQNAFSPIKLELPRNTDRSQGEEIMAQLAACADDGRIPGYPYPLLEAHRLVVIDRMVIDRIQQDLYRNLALEGFSFERIRQLFGDVHDEFRRY